MGEVHQQPHAGSQDGLRPHSQDAAPAAEPGSARWWAERLACTRVRRPRAGGLSTARIVDAAMDVLRTDGPETLTLRAVADRLGTRSASLYRHIAGRDELVALLADHILGDIRITRTGRGWRADAEALMRELRRVLLAQPLPPRAGRDGSGYGPNALRLTDAALAVFLDAGLDTTQAAHAATTSIQFVAGLTDIERSTTGRGPHGATRADGYPELLATLPPNQYTALRTTGPTYLHMPADQVFTYGMHRLLDGITTTLPDHPTPR
ncbi:TetR/AcrR family transcriptional regulator [Yinghuangia sp. ASG 101]|uniref:TetR/AcrR family transcriptional regulator n=1 Tax=Yinghuangia sp. ASG 101 TaxID=2896848 RepID=UPI001E296DE8|nr:TetR/AcrR family transcriptional regulator C-terminal domain-containing protein [Yinghuangia sp. ASG 101]UGQ11450.1 TetR/AcrR family transcriptional regulator [Yinghuangia sp. ASG 101]